MSDLSQAHNTSHCGHAELFTGRLSHTAVLWVISLFALRDFFQPFLSLCIVGKHIPKLLWQRTSGLVSQWEALLGDDGCGRRQTPGYLSLCVLPQGCLPLSLQPTVGASSPYYCSSEILTLSSSVSRLCKHNPYFRFSLFEIPRDVPLFLTDKYVLCLTNFHNSHQFFPKRNPLLPIQFRCPFSAGSFTHRSILAFTILLCNAGFMVSFLC